MKSITQEELKRILELHSLWLQGDSRGERADLSFTDLSGVNLEGFNLTGAVLRYTNLKGTNLKDTILYNTILTDTILTGAILTGANIDGAILTDTILTGAILDNIEYNNSTAFYALQCPEEGSFIGWKKARGYLVKLKIPASAKRSSATSRKCRCSKAKVLSITNICTGEEIQSIESSFSSTFVYRVGETVKVKDFDTNRWNECSTGIHFFITKQEAINY